MMFMKIFLDEQITYSLRFKKNEPENFNQDQQPSANEGQSLYLKLLTKLHIYQYSKLGVVDFI